MKQLQRWSLIIGLAVAAPTVMIWPTGIAATFVEHWQTVGAN